jgi:hypothetical protein
MEVTAELPVTVATSVMQLIAGFPLMTHANTTSPVNPPDGVSVSVELADPPGATLMLPLFVRLNPSVPLVAGKATFVEEDA